MPYNKNMKFREKLTHYRSRARLSKTSLAEKMNLTPTTIMEWESGRKKPPSVDRCNQISEILGLSNYETKKLIDSAMEERLSDEALQWLSGKHMVAEDQVPYISREIIEALQDPAAVKALLAVSRNKEALKKAILEFLGSFETKNFPKKEEIIRLCS